MTMKTVTRIAQQSPALMQSCHIALVDTPSVDIYYEYMIRTIFVAA